MSKHITDTQLIDVLGDLQTKADGRFSKGGGFVFSTDNNNNLQATKNGSPVNIGSGGESGGGSSLMQIKQSISNSRDKERGDEWVIRDVPESARPALVTYHGLLYLIGATVDSTSNKFYTFNGFDAWLYGGTLPYEFNGGAAVVYNDKIHVIGGDAEYSELSPSLRHAVYDGNEWQELSPIDQELGNAGLQCCVSNGYIHCFTFNSNYECIHYRYDGNSWTLIDDIPNDIKESYFAVSSYELDGDDCIIAFPGLNDAYVSVNGSEWEHTSLAGNWDSGYTIDNVVFDTDRLCFVGIPYPDNVGTISLSIENLSDGWIYEADLPSGLSTYRGVAYYDNYVQVVDSDAHHYVYYYNQEESIPFESPTWTDALWLPTIIIVFAPVDFEDYGFSYNSPGIISLSADNVEDAFSICSSINLRVFKQLDSAIILSIDSMPSTQDQFFKLLKTNVTIIWQPGNVSNGEVIDALPRAGSGGGGSSDLPLTVENGVLCITYESGDSGGDDGGR